MIAILKQSASDEAVSHIVSWIEKKGLKTDVSRGENETIIGLVGDTTKIDPFLLESMDVVERVQRVSEPFKRANRKFHPEDSVIDCGHGVKIGGDQFQVIAGPCSVEGENLIRIARRVKAAGATMLRGGAYKPRTSPYAYQGMGPAGLDLLCEASAELDMPIVTEIMDVRHLRSEMGVIYLCSFNEAVIRKTLRESNLVFSELFSARPHIFIGRNNPLAGRERVNMKDLESLPCLTYEQGDQNSFYFSEEILSTLNHEKSIKVTDKGTIIDLMTGTDGYTISSGICPSYLRGDDIIRDANELLQKASDRADEIISEANDKKLAEEREYDRVRLEVTRFKSDVLNLYRTHVESLSRLPEFQQKEEAPAQDAEAELPETEDADTTEEAAPAADAAETEDAAPEKASEDFWEKDESQLKLDPPPADPNAAFQGVNFSE